MTDLSEFEYRSLRATIRERGTARICAILIGFATWGALALTLQIGDLAGAASMVPFVMLVATFEISLFIHTGVERIGRYLQVFYEEAKNVIAWETTAMNYGRSFPGGLDPLFITLFGGAAAINFLSSFAFTTRRPGWIVVSLAAHCVFAWRLTWARRVCAAQRATDLERYRKLQSMVEGQ